MHAPAALIYLALVVAVGYWVWASIVATPDQTDHDA